VSLWAETTVPIAYDLNTEYGRKQHALADEPLLSKIKFIQLPTLSGNDASCLNLNKVAQPSVIGVPSALFDSQKMFSFVSLDDEVNKSAPWDALNRTYPANTIVAFADQTVITWGLQKKTGDTLKYLDEAGNTLNIKLIGGLENSIFQGYILISDSLFHKSFPSHSSSRVLLIDSCGNEADTIASSLSYLLQDLGITMVPASQRLAEFNTIQNTYLSVFVMLGGLGIIIGVLGLGFFLVRNMQERQWEMSLYIALGFNRRHVRKLIFYEYGIMLVAGILIGALSGMVSVIPSLLSPSVIFPWKLVVFILVLMFAAGMLSVLIPLANRKRLLWKSLNE
jgi:ABC-type antimicrobial peptide transport system permease subunit